MNNLTKKFALFVALNIQHSIIVNVLQTMFVINEYLHKQLNLNLYKIRLIQELRNFAHWTLE